MLSKDLIQFLINAPHAYTWPENLADVSDPVSQRKNEFSGFYRFYEVLKIIEEIKPQGDILDLASGHGTLADVLYKAGYKVHACDFDKDSFKANRNIPWVYSDLNVSIPYEKETFEMICGIEIIEHIQNQSDLLKKCSYILKPEGYLILTTPNTVGYKSTRLMLQQGNLAHFTESNNNEHINPVFPWIIEHLAQNENLVLKTIRTNIYLPLSFKEYSLLFLSGLVFRGRNIISKNINYGSHLIYIFQKLKE
jgi:2-polyprenyl-3-methyl-5-hydroxy-6-metoxy-1,4-benzoquinol methylase